MDESNVLQYGRWHYEFPQKAGVERVVFVEPEGATVERPTFLHQPAELVYDDHGYETVKPRGDVVSAVRYTPVKVGKHRWYAMGGSSTLDEGVLVCENSSHAGYVMRSTDDPRYFALSEGGSYCAIGANMCWPVAYRLSGEREFERTQQVGYLGMGEYHRWFVKMQKAKANFARIWLSNRYFNATPSYADRLDLTQFTRSDALIELARQYGIRLKLCFDHMRGFGSTAPHHIDLCDSNGDQPAEFDEWLTSNKWQRYWWVKVQAYIARYGDDPTVMAWELWNEMDACRGHFDLICQWTAKALTRLAPMVPRQMVVNSLGSHDHEKKCKPYEAFRNLDGLDFQQIHRYLDQGAGYEMVREDPVALSIDAIKQVRRNDRPSLLAETGAVNDNHTGPFRYTRHDDDGILFSDTTYPAFFAGGAGCGHMWFWDRYVDEKNLWDGYEPLAQLIEGVSLHREQFEPVDVSTDLARTLALKGREHVLIWIRNRRDRWDHVLRDRRAVVPITGMNMSLRQLEITDATVQFCRSWREVVGEARVCDARLMLPRFRRMLFIRLGKLSYESV